MTHIEGENILAVGMISGAGFYIFKITVYARHFSSLAIEFSPDDKFSS
jgi:ribosomal protein L18E